MKRQKKRVCYSDEKAANKALFEIPRSEPTLQTITAATLDSENQLFNHYHRFLRDDMGSNWQDSIVIGDVLEFNYSSTFKSRVNAMHNSQGQECRPRVTLLHDMPQWIPVVVTSKAYSATIEYVNKNKQDERPLQERIRLGASTKRHDSARLRPKSGKKPQYLKEGTKQVYEVYDEERAEWSQCKIVDIIAFVEFRYKTHCGEWIYDSCYMDELNVRLPSKCIPCRALTKKDVGRAVRVYWSHSGGEWYSATVQDVDETRKILVLFYKDRYMEELKWNVQTTLFYFPISNMDELRSWIYLRPQCGFCCSLMQERGVTQNRYSNNVCWRCNHQFVAKDSLWVCPHEKRVKFHPRRYYLDSQCVNKLAEFKQHDIFGVYKVESDRAISNLYKSRNTNLTFGHRNQVVGMAELYRVPIGAPLPHLQLVDINERGDEDKPIAVNKEVIEQNMYLRQYIHHLYASVLYHPYSDQEYYRLCKRYLHSNFVPLKRNRKTALEGDDVVKAAKFSFSTKLQKVIAIFQHNHNKTSLFYLLKAVEMRYFYILNAWNGRPVCRLLSENLTMHHKFGVNMANAIIPPTITNTNNHLIEEIAQNHKVNTAQPRFIRFTSDPDLSGFIGAAPEVRGRDKDEGKEVEAVEDDSSAEDVFPARMGGAHCVPQFDICIMVRDGNVKGKSQNKSSSTQKSRRGRSTYELYRSASAIVIQREDSEVTERQNEWGDHREAANCNPWIRGDPCMIFVDASAEWTEAKVVKIYETECKVDVYGASLQWPKHRVCRQWMYSIPVIQLFDCHACADKTYGALSQYMRPKMRTAEQINIEDIPMVDRLSNGVPVKVWGPPWREGRVLWKWNEDDLVCIQFEGQRLEYALTFHVNDPKWKIEILANKARRCRDIQPPLQFVMAKRKLLALDTPTINTGLLVLSSDSDSDYEHLDDAEEEREEIDENDYIDVLDLSAVTKSRKRRRQRLDQVKIVKMQKNKLQRVTSRRKKRKRTRKSKRCVCFRSLSLSLAALGLNEHRQGIQVEGIEEGAVFYADERINIRWRLNRCVIYDDAEDIDLAEKEFNIYIECKNYQCRDDGRVELEIDKILLDSHVSVRPDSSGMYSYSTILPLSFLQYEDEEEPTEAQSAIVYFRVVFINAEYFRFRLNGCSDVFELRNEYSKKRAIGWNVAPLSEREGCDDKKGCNCDWSASECESLGAFCVCGAIQYNVDDPAEEKIEIDEETEEKTIEKGEKEKMVQFVQCDYCFSWQHLQCLGIDKVSDDDSVKHQCPWCSDDIWSLKYFNGSKLEKMSKKIKMLFAASRYKGRRYGSFYRKKEKFDKSSNPQNVKYLKSLCIARGVDFKSNSAEELASNLSYFSRFARTPLPLGQFMCSLFGINDQVLDDKAMTSLRICDLMAGNGNITRFISKRHSILAVERKQMRLESGRRLVSNATWCGLDAFSDEFLTQFVLDKTYDVVYCNPDIHNMIPSLYIGLEMIKGSKFKKKCLIYLLPIDAFDKNSWQSRLYRLLKCHVSKMYMVGRWNYYDKPHSHPKSVCDAVWIIKPGHSNNTFRCYDVRSSNRLSAKHIL